MTRCSRRPVECLLSLLGCVAAMVTQACTMERASQPSAEMPSTTINWQLSADVTVDMSRKLTGTARKSRLLFFNVEGPTRFADGVFVSTEPGLLTWLFGGAYDDLKSAAAYEAVYGKADVLVNPQWAVTKEDYLFFAVTKVTVTGYPGTIRSFHNSFDAMKGRPSATTAEPSRSRAFAEPTSTVPATLTSEHVAPTTAPSPEETARALVPPKRGTPALTVTDLQPGIGSSAAAGDLVSYHYVCAVLDGPVVFDSRTQGQVRIRKAGSTDAPAGLGEGLIGVRSGMQRQLLIPPDLAYGVEGLPSAKIPSNATLLMDVYVDQVTPAKR